MSEPGWLSALPPLLAITLAIWSRQVYLSLFAGIFLGWTLLSGGNPLLGLARALEGCVRVFQDTGNTHVILFSVLVGALITLMQRSGGVDGFVNTLTGGGLVRSRRSAQLMSTIVGCLVFIESSITSLIVGAVSRPVYDRYKISREKLAYICDSTSAPVCILVPLNAWGAFIMRQLDLQQVAQPLGVLLAAIPLNFYALAALALVFFVVLSGWDFGPMRAAERRAVEEGKVLADGAQPLVSDEVIAIAALPGAKPRAFNMLAPVAAMIVMMPVGLAVTGAGDITAGSGSTAVFWAVLAAISLAALMYLSQRLMSLRDVTDLVLKGMGGLIPMGVLMVLAFAIGDVARELKTGEYMAQLARMFLVPALIPAVIFLASAFMAFSTGTSFGTFAIMMPIAVPVALNSGVNLPLAVAAVLGGGVFGDHCSPISDTTLVASMASASDHIDHVRTQLPYALLAALGAAALYLIAGFCLR